MAILTEKTLKMLMKCLIMALILGVCVGVWGYKTKLQAPLFNNLGSFHYAISTKVPLAQRFFDQGFILFYGFEWGESIRSFKEATRLDPNCGMCYWGLALALGSKINAPITGNEYQEAKAAMQKALALTPYATPREQDYIKALSLRFQHSPQSFIHAEAFSCHGSGLDASSHKEMMDYANAMRKVAAKYPQDQEAKVLYAAALFWNKVGSGLTDDDPTVIAMINTLKAVIAQDKLNIGANHYYIHTIESLSHPEAALENAARFKTLVPGSEHLIHMPAHIYFLTGRYHQATEANLQAIATYQRYNQSCRGQGFEPEISYLYLHNYDFLRTSASMEGRKQLAIFAAKQLVNYPFALWLARDSSLQWFIPIPYYVEARFGMWNNLLTEPMPKSEYLYALGMWHYARGMALAHLNEIKNARDELSKLNNIIQKGPINENLGEQGLNLLNIANQVLMATFADIDGDQNAMLQHLKAASQIQYDMGYHEPPDWYFPLNQAIGDAYLKWGHPKEAVSSYEQDLQQYPQNGWSLLGLANGLRRLGQNQAADRVEKEFRRVWIYSNGTYNR